MAKRDSNSVIRSLNEWTGGHAPKRQKGGEAPRPLKHIPLFTYPSPTYYVVGEKRPQETSNTPKHTKRKCVSEVVSNVVHPDGCIVLTTRVIIYPEFS